MPINPVQARAKGKDPMDKILQGLQIANEVFKIPVGVQDIRTKQREIDAVDTLNEGNPNNYSQVKNKLVKVSGPMPAAPTNPLNPPTSENQEVLPAPKDTWRTQDSVDKENAGIQDRSDRVFKLAEKYDIAHRASLSMEQLYQQAVKGNPAAQMQYAKAFSSFNDTPRFGESEQKGMEAMSPLFDKMMLAYKDVVAGKREIIPAELIEQIHKAAIPLTAAQDQSHRELLTPLYLGAVRQNQPVKEIFSPHALKLLSAGDGRPAAADYHKMSDAELDALVNAKIKAQQAATAAKKSGAKK